MRCRSTFFFAPLLLLGCARDSTPISTPIQESVHIPREEAIDRFLASLASNSDVVESARRCFVIGAPAADYARAFEKTKKWSKNDETIYTFWPRNASEGDRAVSVIVKGMPPKITDVDIGQIDY